MWATQSQQISSHTVKLALIENARPMTRGDVIHLWQYDASFRSWFADLIRRCPYEALFWETPPISRQLVDRPFECVMVEGRALLSLQPDPAPFASWFSSQTREPVVAFPNLGGDAMLIVPVPIAGVEGYGHLASFHRQAPVSQVDAFWHTTGRALQTRLTNQPVWLSTAGMGVSWLHLRIDSRPKYYRYQPYTAER